MHTVKKNSALAMSTSSKKRARFDRCLAPVLCPVCCEHFRAPPEVTAPRQLPCAHVVCMACLDALNMADEAGCPVCCKPAEPHVPNVALANYAEEVYRENSDVMFGLKDDTCLPTPLTLVTTVAERQEYVDALGGLMQKCSDGRARLLASAAAVCADKIKLSADTAALCAKWIENMDALEFALKETRGKVLYQLRAEGAARLKTLETEQDELEVSAGQLDAAVAMSHTALARPELLLNTLSSVTAMAALADARPVRAMITTAPLPPSSDQLMVMTSSLTRVQCGLLECERARNEAATLTAERFAHLIQVASPPGCASKLCETIAHMCERFVSNRVAFTPACVNALVSAMTMCIGSEEVISNALQALHWFASGAERTPDNTAALLQSIPTVMISMDLFKTSETVCDWAIAALWEFANVGGSEEELRCAIVRAGGLSRLYAAMKTWSASVRVQRAGLTLLQNLAMTDATAKDIVDSNAFALVVYPAMQTWLDVPGVQSVACVLLHNCSYNDENRAAILKSGGLMYINAAMDTHDAIPCVLEAGCAALASLAHGRAHKNTVMQSGALARVCKALEQCVDVVDVQVEGCAALCSLMEIDTSVFIPTFVATGGLLRLYEAMIRHEGSSPVQLWCTKTLFRIACCAAGKAAIRGGRGQELCARAQAIHVSHHGVQRWSLQVLAKLVA
jgi:hypothetical protein